jgi:hypothetical protein
MADELRALIGRVRRRWFAQVALCNLGRAAALASVPVWAAALAERLLDLHGGALVTLAVATGVLAIGLTAWSLMRMRPRPADRQVARFIEERAAALPGAPPMDDALVSAVDVSDAPPDSALAGFVPLIVAAAVRRLQALSPDGVVPSAAIRKAALQAAGGAVALGAALWVAMPGAMRALDTARVQFFPGWISVDVAPGDVRVPAGSPVQIRATVRGGQTTLERFPPELTVSAGGEQQTVRMTPRDGGFEFAFESVDRTFAYRVTAGAARSAEYTVTALLPPRVERIDVRYAYPSFTGLAERTEEDGGDIYAPAGTRVRLRIHADKPLAAGALALGRTAGSRMTLRAAGERTLEADLVLTRDDSYRISLRDRDGLASSDGSEYFIRLMDDRPPDVRIVRPSADQSITPLEEVAIEARADDDYGISRLELVYSVAGGPERVVPFTTTGGTDIQRIGSRLLAAEELGVKPGDVIAYYARAWDVGRGKRPTRAQSDMFFLEVKPFSEEFVAAQSQAGAGGGGGSAQIEALISAQKEIISATWNIERRSGSGVSADDLKRIAAAQSDLRQRVEQLAARANRGRGRFRPPERLAPQMPRQTPRAPSSDPMAAALEAMSRALQQLEAQKTKDALPHEMAALNGLLEAQAEVRRREVSRQTSGGGGGSNRSGQDLSALFDRELQRQQRTNYENRSQIEERPERGEQAGESAADRIRDLARRQEELNRQQRELASGGLSAEEMKRQLERLTREQQQLREQAEELARQMGRQGEQAGRQLAQPQGQQGQQQPGAQGQRGAADQPPGSQGQRGQSNDAQGAGGGMREASEQMRSAASELRRQDPTAAAERGERAAEQLRRLEQQTRANTPGASGRTSSDLQLEAQQVAQEQRRIAAEAERLESAQGGAAAEARRRLAGEKERLAGRVDELQRAAGDQARRDPSAKGMAEAARELDQQRIGERMRDSAQQLRGAADLTGKPSNAAQGERELARALDKVADTMGGGATGDLSNRLDETREMRERLNRLEQQMREAETRQQAGREGQPGQQGRQGRQGARGSGGGGEGAGDLDKLKQEYQRELQRAREALGRLAQSEPRDGLGASTPEQHEFSRSAPGTESFKQDRGGWESLRRDVDLAMERYEAAVSDRLARTLAEHRLSAGGSDRVPERYRRQVARYYESLAKVKK